MGIIINNKPTVPTARGKVRPDSAASPTSILSALEALPISRLSSPQLHRPLVAANTRANAHAYRVHRLLAGVIADFAMMWEYVGENGIGRAVFGWRCEKRTDGDWALLLGVSHDPDIPLVLHWPSELPPSLSDGSWSREQDKEGPAAVRDVC